MNFSRAVPTKRNIAFTWGIPGPSQPIIQFYNPQMSIKISCNASKKGLGVILEQQCGDQWLSIVYASRAIMDTQSRYALIEQEGLAIHFACEHFHQYIYGRSVQVQRT